MRPLRVSVIVLFLLLSTVAAFAQVPENARVPITDPALLAQLRAVSPPGTKFYMLPGALEATRPVEASDPRLIPYQFGGVHFASTSVSGDEFEPQAFVELTKLAGWVEFDGSGPVIVSAVATLHLETGVLWDGVLWWAYDSSIHNMDFQLFEYCWPFAAGGPTSTLLASGSTSGSGGNQILFTGIPAPVTIQNSLCSYYMQIKRSNLDGAIGFYRGRAGWFRQVSPAPLTATFPNDVPTNHSFFRFVEALAAAGITAGCGPDSFCPDAPLTRGQMAVFLSVALGLHWPF